MICDGQLWRTFKTYYVLTVQYVIPSYIIAVYTGPRSFGGRYMHIMFVIYILSKASSMDHNDIIVFNILFFYFIIIRGQCVCYNIVVGCSAVQ